MSFFLGKKKRDLCDQSRNGKDTKKVKEKVLHPYQMNYLVMD